MHKFLSSFFTTPDSSSNQSVNSQSCNSISFDIDTTQKVRVKMDIYNTSSDDADRLGLCLFLMNEGYYVQSLLDIMSDIAKEDPNKARFIQQAISVWSAKILEADHVEYSDQPIIKPTQFNTTTKT